MSRKVTRKIHMSVDIQGMLNFYGRKSMLDDTLAKETKESLNEWIDKESAGLIRVGDKVKINLQGHERHGEVGVITHLDHINAGSVGATFEGIGLLYVPIGNLDSVDLPKHTETCTNICPSQTATDCHRLQDTTSCSKLDQRLHVAAIIMSGLLVHNASPVKRALELTDELIAACYKRCNI